MNQDFYSTGSLGEIDKRFDLACPMEMRDIRAEDNRRKLRTFAKAQPEPFNSYTSSRAVMQGCAAAMQLMCDCSVA